MKTKTVKASDFLSDMGISVIHVGAEDLNESEKAKKEQKEEDFKRSFLEHAIDVLSSSESHERFLAWKESLEDDEE